MDASGGRDLPGGAGRPRHIRVLVLLDQLDLLEDRTGAGQLEAGLMYDRVARQVGRGAGRLAVLAVVVALLVLGGVVFACLLGGFVVARLVLGGAGAGVV